MINPSFSGYSTRLNESQFLPNFWVSELYWDRAGWTVHVDDSPDHWMSVLDSNGAVMLPALDVGGNPHPTMPFWASLIGMDGATQLDANYLYEPIFRDQLVGGKWRDLRKSLARVERELGGALALRQVSRRDWPRIEDLALAWAGDRELYDPDVMMRYLLHGPNMVVYQPGKANQPALGVVAWDTNFRFVNFRYCLVDSTGPVGLDEYARWLFWAWAGNTFPPWTKINDGGGLDRDGLHRYKQKLNPINKFTIWSKP